MPTITETEWLVISPAASEIYMLTKMAEGESQSSEAIAVPHRGMPALESLYNDATSHYEQAKLLEFPMGAAQAESRQQAVRETLDHKNYHLGDHGVRSARGATLSVWTMVLGVSLALLSPLLFAGAAAALVKSSQGAATAYAVEAGGEDLFTNGQSERSFGFFKATTRVRPENTAKSNGHDAEPGFVTTGGADGHGIIKNDPAWQGRNVIFGMDNGTKMAPGNYSSRIDGDHQLQ